MTLYRHSGLFNRQGLDTVYEDYFVLLLSSPLLTTRQFIDTQRTNKNVGRSRPIIWQYSCISRSFMMFMLRKRKYTLSQTLLDGRQVSEISSTVNKYDIKSSGNTTVVLHIRMVRQRTNSDKEIQSFYE